MKCLIFCFVLVSAVWPIRAADEKAPPAAATPGTVTRIGVDLFDKLRADKKNVVLDVRTQKEFKDGHIPGAVNIDINSPDFDKKVADLDKNKTYLVHCAGGVRSARACKKLEGMGFKELYDLAPGYRGWEKAGKPTEK